jgi:hypothetical protein
MNERHAYLIAGTSLVCAAVCGLLIIALRNQRPCPCAEHTPEAEAARIAQASAEVAWAPTEDDLHRNGNFVGAEQEEVSE